MKEIKPIDNKGKFHGYQERYYTNGKIWFRGKLIHGLVIGYSELHFINQTDFYIR